MLRMATDRCISGNLHQQPGRDAHRDKEGKEHGCGRVRRNGRHIRPHQPGHEHHRQQGRNDSQCGNNRWVANFRHRINGRLYARPAVSHGPVSGNIFDHDDRIINQNTDREDQGKQADPVDCVAHHQRRKQGQQDGGRNNNECDQRFAPADREGDQDHNRNRCQPQMEEQLIGLVVCRFTIITRWEFRSSVQARASVSMPATRTRATSER